MNEKITKLKEILEEVSIEELTEENIKSIICLSNINIILRKIVEYSTQDELDEIILSNEKVGIILLSYLELSKDNNSSYIGNSISLYLKEIREYPVLENEKELLIKCKKGDMEARDILIKHNLKFVIAIVKKYNKTGLSFDDLVQEGNIGLIEAIDRYDISKNTKLVTYAQFWIRKCINESIYNKTKSIRLPFQTELDRNAVKKAMNHLMLQYGDNICDEDISKETGLSVGRIDKIRNMPEQVINLECVSDDKTTELKEFVYDQSIVDNDEILIEKEKKEKLFEAISQLSEREQHIICEKYGVFDEPKTYAIIGEQMNLSKQRVHQIEKGALNRLKRNENLRELVK